MKVFLRERWLQRILVSMDDWKLRDFRIRETRLRHMLCERHGRAQEEEKCTALCRLLPAAFRSLPRDDRRRKPLAVWQGERQQPCIFTMHASDRPIQRLGRNLALWDHSCKRQVHHKIDSSWIKLIIWLFLTLSRDFYCRPIIFMLCFYCSRSILLRAPRNKPNEYFSLAAIASNPPGSFVFLLFCYSLCTTPSSCVAMLNIPQQG